MLLIFNVSWLFFKTQIGTYQVAVMAKTLNKPFYVVAESFKFVRMFPLNQDDLPNAEKVNEFLKISPTMARPNFNAIAQRVNFVC